MLACLTFSVQDVSSRDVEAAMKQGVHSMRIVFMYCQCHPINAKGSDLVANIEPFKS